MKSFSFEKLASEKPEQLELARMRLEANLFAASGNVQEAEELVERVLNAGTVNTASVKMICHYAEKNITLLSMTFTFYEEFLPISQGEVSSFFRDVAEAALYEVAEAAKLQGSAA